MTVTTHKSLMDLHPRELKGIVQDIPTLPVIYQELFNRMQDPDVGVPQLANIITKDPALTVKVLHLVNSAFYGSPKEIKTISRAVVILGFQAVRSAALAISVFDYFGDEESSSEVDMTRFWEHSIAVAAICKVLAAEFLPRQQEEAFVVGLLHDVGKLIEKRQFAEDFDEVCKVAQELHLSWYDCEKQLFQLTHATIGKAVFRAWGFPGVVVESVQHHHTPASARTHPQMASLVHVANFIAYEMGHGAPGAYPSDSCDKSALNLLGVDFEKLEGHEAEIRGEIDRAMQILKLIE